ncbi:MAG: universal stress protein, UspA [Desulfobulbaceae bacterium]|nr:universal stress protein, UspA [Desulfobulbaceae bacterium]
MQRFANILLIAAGNNWRETALERAVSLAKENQAELTLVDVIELSGDLQVIGRDKLDKLTSEIIGKRLAQLDNMVQHVRDRITIQTRVIPGTAFLEIIREVLRNNYDLVMKISGGRRRLKNLLLGSTDMHLLRKCPCPVWLMKPGESVQYQRVLAAVDIEPESGDRQETALNKQILEMASSLALSEFGELHVIHAWMGNGRTILDGIGADYDDADVEDWGKRAWQLHRSWLDDQERQLLKTLGKDTMDYLAPNLHLIEGEACEVITDFVEKKRVDVVVMGTVARTGISGFFMGNTAESILNTIDCSVLAVKPPGFVTPVTLPDG